jgi:hypothetical protein
VRDCSLPNVSCSRYIPRDHAVQAIKSRQVGGIRQARSHYRWRTRPAAHPNQVSSSPFRPTSPHAHPRMHRNPARNLGEPIHLCAPVAPNRPHLAPAVRLGRPAEQSTCRQTPGRQALSGTAGVVPPGRAEALAAISARSAHPAEASAQCLLTSGARQGSFCQDDTWSSTCQDIRTSCQAIQASMHADLLSPVRVGHDIRASCNDRWRWRTAIGRLGTGQREVGPITGDVDGR